MAAQTNTTVEDRRGLWLKGLAFAVIAATLVLILVVANQIGGILIARDLRDDYQELVDQQQPADGQSGAEGQAAQPVAASAAGPAETGDVIPALVDKADLGDVADGETNVGLAPEMPAPSGRSEPAIVDVGFEVVENVSTIDAAKGTQVETWGYKVTGGDDSVVSGTPGPVVRARVGDVLRFTITNPEGNTMPHNVDFHAVTGQGGGAEATTVLPGETRTIEARLLYPGFFMYHCAYGDVPAHIAQGMYGGILVDPETPLPEADHEWYMVQSEFYTQQNAEGAVEFDRTAVTDEAPSHVVFNGAVGALTDDNALKMKVGERSRIYFVNAGLNLTSNFHPIGSQWDTVYQEAALSNEPLRGSQTTLVPAGGGTVVDMVGYVPMTAILVDHALARAFDKGAIGQVVIEGEEDAEIYEVLDAAEDPAVAEAAQPGAESEGPAQSEAPAGEVDAAPSGETQAVSIVQGAGDFQEEGAADEFDENESMPDYSVNVLQVKVGDTVTWTNDDSAMIHTVTATDGSFDSGFLDSGDEWSYTFTEAGEFEYLCTPHPWMMAKVVVTE